MEGRCLRLEKQAPKGSGLWIQESRGEQKSEDVRLQQSKKTSPFQGGMEPSEMQRSLSPELAKEWGEMG